MTSPARPAVKPLLALWLAVRVSGDALVNTNAPPFFVTSTCQGHEQEYAPCTGNPECPICIPQDCKFGEWSQWQLREDCAGLCMRQRQVWQESNECGFACQGSLEETKNGDDCYPEHCPSHDVQDAVNCQWNEWSSWSQCVGNQQRRVRGVLQEAKNNGQECPGLGEEVRRCGDEPANCQWQEWFEWSECSVTCGTGVRSHRRAVWLPARNGGLPCEGSTKELEACEAMQCEGTEQPCTVGDWSEWQECSAGQEYQTREILTYTLGHCSHPLKKTRGCASGGAGVPCGTTEWSAWSGCSRGCGGQRARLRGHELSPDCFVLGDEVLEETGPCQAVCQECGEISTWSEWAECSVTCGIGEAKRTRTVPEGKECAMPAVPIEEVRECKADPCASEDCQWGRWEDWSECTKSCGRGLRQRRRDIERFPRGGGKPCAEGDKEEVRPCNTLDCEHSLNGTWADWDGWSACTATCGEGYLVRHRDVSSRPNQFGQPATGLDKDVQKCENLPMCQEEVKDCKLSEWKEWSECSWKCTGIRERIRRIEQHPTWGGKICDKMALRQQESCNPLSGEKLPYDCEPHPSNCSLSDWEMWQPCSASCDGGMEQRFRHLRSPNTENGKPCSGNLSEVAPCNTKLCDEDKAIHCEWADWGNYGACSRDSKVKYRHRGINQHANYLGKPCEGKGTKEVTSCIVPATKVLYCSWSEWSDESGCSAVCGPATKTRQRSLRTVEQVHNASDYMFKMKPDGSAVCEGTEIKMFKCPFFPCHGNEDDQDCQFAPWAEWSAPDGTSLCAKSRQISQISVGDGLPCNGTLEDTKHCFTTDSIPEDCAFEEWHPWTACSDVDKKRQRQRHVLKNGINGGELCVGPLSESQSCIESHDCDLVTWSAWSQCSCNMDGCNGQRTRQREIHQYAAGDGLPCPEESLKEVEICNAPNGLQPSKDVPCRFGDWSLWSGCSANGVHYRQRSIRNYAAGHVFASCEGTLMESKDCATMVECELAPWTPWSECTRSCGGGQQYRDREMTKPPRGGLKCPSDLSQTQGCNLDDCPDALVSEWSAWGECSSSCGSGYHNRQRELIQWAADSGRPFLGPLIEAAPCTAGGAQCHACQECLWGEWTSFSQCSQPCGGGQRTRDRRIDRAPPKGCTPCEALDSSEVEACNSHPCSDSACLDGLWGEWSGWSECSHTCEGTQQRSRDIVREGNYCGKAAEGFSLQQQMCNRDISCETPLSCLFDEWTPWSACPTACQGVRARGRGIARPAGPNGAQCEGPSKETESCPGVDGFPCAHVQKRVDCVISEWSEWAPCGSTCGNGQRERLRSVLVEGSNGGDSCSATLSLTAPCKLQECDVGCVPQDCTWGQWNEWAQCQDGLLANVQRRHRSLDSPARCNGVCPAGPTEEVRPCQKEAASRAIYYCTWSLWQDWSECTNSCGSKGTKKRSRFYRAAEKTADGETNALRLLGYDSATANVSNTIATYEALDFKRQDLQARRVRTLSLSWGAGALSLLLVICVVKRGRSPSSSIYAPMA